MIGTGIIGGILAYPVAALLMGKEAAVFTYVVPFLLSCSFGAVMAYVFLKVPAINKCLVKNRYKADKI